MSHMPIEVRPLVAVAELADVEAMPLADIACQCGRPLVDGSCRAFGACDAADLAVSRPSMVRGTASAWVPSAFTLGGRVD